MSDKGTKPRRYLSSASLSPHPGGGGGGGWSFRTREKLVGEGASRSQIAPEIQCERDRDRALLSIHIGESQDVINGRFAPCNNCFKIPANV